MINEQCEDESVAGAEMQAAESEKSENNKPQSAPTGFKFFISSFLKFSVSTWINLFISVGTVIITTRIFIPETYGTISIFNNMALVIMSFACLGFDSGYIRFFFDLPKGYTTRKLFIKCILPPLIILCSVGLVSCLFFYNQISYLIFKTYSFVIPLMLFINSFAQILARFLIIKLRMSKKTLWFNIVSVLSKLLTSFFVILSIAFPPSDETVLTLNTAGITILMIAVYLFLIIKHLAKRKKARFLTEPSVPQPIQKGAFLHIAKVSLLFAPIAIITYINTVVTQLIVSDVFDTHSLGIYASTNAFIGLIGAFSGGFSNFWSGYIYENYKTNQEQIKKVHDYICLISVIIMIGFLLFKDVAYLLLDKAYYPSQQFFAFTLIAPLLLLIGDTTAYGISISKKNHFYIIAYVISLSVNIVCCYFLSKKIGLVGAALSAAISGIVLFILSSIFGQKYYKTINHPFRTGAVTLILFLLSAVNYLLYDLFMNYIAIAFILLIVCILFRKEIKDIINLIKKRSRKES